MSRIACVGFLIVASVALSVHAADAGKWEASRADAAVEGVLEVEQFLHLAFEHLADGDAGDAEVFLRYDVHRERERRAWV